ncbi:sensor histidine kinase [Microbacterium sp. cf332]|uniref:sensor histidine kinase n=1 Tax=Microbacterium sp. cf332 TaxID=1761804 RepID=UPI000886D26D|nr:histidine kinase [Microbacterium sp. cf332]SDQ09948.1 Signal transduction histidine kinase [Microbacterium sp. cf332]
MSPGSRGSSSSDDDLRLPRAPGVLRRFWGRHPVFADILTALVCLLLSLVPATSFTDRMDDAIGIGAHWPITAPVVMVVIVLGCASLLLRRRFPTAVFVIAALVALAYLLAPVATGGPILGIAAYTLAVHRSTRACLMGVAIALGVIGTAAATLGLTGWIAPTIAWNALVGEILTALIGALIGTNIGNRQRYVAALIDRSRQLVVERDQQARLASAAERDRIARELHDIVAHSLTVMVALAEGVAASSDIDRARPGATAIATTGREALRDMRATLGVLRDGGAAPLVPLARDTTAETVSSARAAGFDATLTVSGDRAELPGTVQLAISRIVQEGVTNAMRHARGATRIDVRIAHRPEGVEVEVVDDGDQLLTAPADNGGYGIRGLRERVGLAGGAVTAGPGPGLGRGWRVHAYLPREQENHER